MVHLLKFPLSSYNQKIKRIFTLSSKCHMGDFYFEGNYNVCHVGDFYFEGIYNVCHVGDFYFEGIYNVCHVGDFYFIMFILHRYIYKRKIPRIKQLKISV